MDTLISISPASRIENELRQQLAPDEKILWSAQPDPKRMKRVFAAWIFAIPWTGYAIFMTYKVITMFLIDSSKMRTDLLWAALIPSMFVLFGIFMILSPLRALKKARNSIHALTNQRILTFVVDKDRSVNSVMFDDMGPISLTEKSDGWGNLTIETGSHNDSKGNRVTETFDIIGVPEVAKLERLLREAQQAR